MTYHGVRFLSGPVHGGIEDKLDVGSLLADFLDESELVSHGVAAYDEFGHPGVITQHLKPFVHDLLRSSQQYPVGFAEFRIEAYILKVQRKGG